MSQRPEPITVTDEFLKEFAKLMSAASGALNSTEMKRDSFVGEIAGHVVNLITYLTPEDRNKLEYEGSLMAK